MPVIAFATCAAAPELQPSDALAAAALERHGVSVVAAPWNGEQNPFHCADMTVVRSTWDYQKSPSRFRDWLGAVDAADIVNAPELTRWNMSKSYLFELARKGAPLPPMRRIPPEAAAISDAMDALGLTEAVVKPEIGATASGLSRVRRDDRTGIAAAAKNLGMRGLIQPLLPEIETVGETSLVFFEGDFSHAVTKKPPAGSILCQAEHGGVATRSDPPPRAIDEARLILAMLPKSAVYARVDVIVLDERMWLMEVEVIEPELFFTHAPEAAETFAAALINRLK